MLPSLTFTSCHFNFPLSLSPDKRTNGQCASSLSKKCPCLPLFICVFHLSVQSTVDKGLCKGCLRTRRSSSSIFFEVVFWSKSIVNLFWREVFFNEFWLKQYQVKATLNQVYYCFKIKYFVKMCVFQNVSRSFRFNWGCCVGDDRLNWMSICREVDKERKISFGPL